MSSTILNAIQKINADKHAVGSLNNWRKDVVNLGAVVKDEAIDNWAIVELSFDDVTGERMCAKLSDVTHKGYLIASVEDYMMEYETIKNFFNAKGERARVIKLTAGDRFETSLYKLDNEGKPVKNGQKAHWDVTEGKYIISNDSSDHANYATAGNKLVVVDAVGDTLDGQHVIRFEVVE